MHPSSAQHLMRRFLAKNRVIWFNTIGMRPPRATVYDVRKILRKIRHWARHLAAGLAPREGNACIDPSPEIYDIPLAPLTFGPAARKLNAWILRRAVRKCLMPPLAKDTRLGLPFRARRAPKVISQNPVSPSPSHCSDPFIISTLPLTADLVGTIPGANFIYYLVDDYASWPGLTGKLVRQMDQEQARAADRVVAASRALADLHRPVTNRIDYFPHGVDVDHFAQGRTVRAQRKRDGLKPIADVIFFGALDERIDHDLFNAVIQARPEHRFLCIGPKTGSKNRLASAPNLERRSPVPFDELPNLLGQCEIAFLPYVQTDLGQRLAPLKALEALAAGMPVVATDIPELRELAEGTTLAKNVEDILSGLDRAFRGNILVPSLEALAAHSWENRAERLSEILLSARAVRTSS